MPELFTVSGDNQVSLPEVGVVLIGLDFGFEQNQPAQAVIISPTNDATDSAALILSTFTSWTDDQIILDVPAGPIPSYWFVRTVDGLTNLDGLFVTGSIIAVS